MMSMTKKNIVRASAVALAFCLLATAAPAMNADAAGKTKLNKKKITVKVGKTKKLKVKNLKGKKVKWKTSNKKVVKIKKTKKKTVVKLKGKKAGTATVTAKVGKKIFKCTVVVNKAVNLSPTEDRKKELEKKSEEAMPAISAETLKQLEAQFDQKLNNINQNKIVYNISDGEYLQYPTDQFGSSVNTFDYYFDNWGINSFTRDGKIYPYFCISRTEDFENDSNIKITYTTDGSTPTINSADAKNYTVFAMTSKNPIVKTHIYRNNELVGIRYFVSSHLYLNTGWLSDNNITPLVTR